MKTLTHAGQLAQALVAIGRAQGVKTEAPITAKEVPLGRMVRNALEIKESVEVLKGGGPADVRELSLALAARMLRLAGIAANLDDAERRAREALDSGRAFEKFREVVAHQGGAVGTIDDPTWLPTAPHQHLIRADRAGFAQGWHAELVGLACVMLGAGRDRVEDAVDPGVGAVVLARPGDEVRVGDGLLELHYRDAGRLGLALNALAGACPIGEEAPAKQPLILETLG